jgi:hypothetical protein
LIIHQLFQRLSHLKDLLLLSVCANNVLEEARSGAGPNSFIHAYILWQLFPISIVVVSILTFFVRKRITNHLVSSL